MAERPRVLTLVHQPVESVGTRWVLVGDPGALELVIGPRPGPSTLRLHFRRAPADARDLPSHAACEILGGPCVVHEVRVWTVPAASDDETRIGLGYAFATLFAAHQPPPRPA